MRPHTNNSFSYKTIHPNIKNILEERSKLDNTTQVSMPFIKATTTLQLPGVLGSGVGFTLGIHATEQDIRYQDIYASQNGSYLAGYTYQPDGTNKLIYADPVGGDDLENILKVLNLGMDIDNTTDFSFAPPPGITRVTIGKRRSGLISVANVSFSVPTLIQLEFLHKTFLVPGIGMILEWGQQFAPKKSNFTLGEIGLGEDFSQYMFPWYGENAYGETKEELFQRLARNQISTQEILEKYSYPTQGQYQWMFGRVASFNVNSNPDGSYECVARIVGPAEDSWAYSVRNTTVPAVTRGADSRVCIDNTNSVESYFTKESGIDSFTGVLEATRSGREPGLADWKEFVQEFKHTPDNSEPTVSQDSADDLEDAYFISWRYFVNVILNDENYGVKSIFKNANELPEWLDKISLLRPYTNVRSIADSSSNINFSATDSISRQATAATIQGISQDPELDSMAVASVTVPGEFEDPYENFVGANVFLRSTDLSTMIIVNEEAAIRAENDTQRGLSSGAEAEFVRPSGMVTKIKALGDFYLSAQNINNPPKSNEVLNDRGFLSTGIWINHKAIIQSFSTANTILDGIQNLLTRMSSATNGFWNLAIDVSEPVYETIEQLNVYNYTVVDLNYVEHSEYAVKEFLNSGSDNRVHIFNKFIRNDKGVLVGSELTDCKVDISLPKALFSQIATLGLVQPQDVGLDDEQIVEPATVSDINDQLRQMFSITSLARDADGNSADLTALTVNTPNSSTCSGQVPTQDEAGTLPGGRANVSNETIPTSGAEIDSQIRDTEDQLDVLNDFIALCEQNCQRDSALSEVRVRDLPDDRKISELTIGEIKQRQANGRLFAVGRYQVIPGTLADAARVLRLLDSTTFSEDIQERIGDYLLTEKGGRERLSDYLTGKSDNIDANIDAAHKDLANEFEALAGPSNEPTSKLGVRGNVTNTTSGQVRSALINARQALGRPNQLGPLKRLIASVESGGDGLDAANVRTDTGPVTLRVDSPNYKLAINNRSFIRGATLDTPVNDISGRNNLFTTCGSFLDSLDPAAASSQFEITQPIQRTPLGPAGAVPSQPANLRRVSVSECNRVLRIRQSLEDRTRQLSIQRGEISRENRLKEIKRRFPHLKAIYRYFEPFPDYMMANIRKTSDGNSSNAFGAAPGALSIKADLELPGINGLRLGELFWLDRIPSFYRAYGAFIVLGIEEEITPSGWITKIGSSFYYLGNAWKTQVARILRGEIES